MLYVVQEKDAKSALSIKPAKVLRDRSMQSGNSQFANHTCCTMHRNVDIEIVTVQAASDDEHSNPITTVKPDVVVILRADQGIVMGEWIKTQYTDVQLNFNRIFACRCCFHEMLLLLMPTPLLFGSMKCCFLNAFSDRQVLVTVTKSI